MADLQAIDRELRAVSGRLAKAEAAGEHEHAALLQLDLDELLDARNAAIAAMTTLGYKRTDDERWVPAK